MSRVEGGHPIRAWVIVLVALVAVAAGFGVRRATTPSPATDLPASGEQVADFELDSLAGGRVSTRDYRGRVLVVDFWATWCGPCRIQAEILHRLQEEHAGDPVSFVAINVGEPEALIREFVGETPFAYPVLMDPTQSLSAQYGVYALPTVLVADGRGLITYLQAGISTEGQVGRAIDSALASG